MPLPPGPSTPAPLQTFQWMRDTFGLLDRCHARFGDTFTLSLAGAGPMALNSDPALVHSVFTGDPDVLLAGQGNDILLPFLGAHSLITLDGKPHARDRKLMTPPFHGQRMRAYGRIIQEAVRRATARWQAGAEVTAHPAMQAASLEVILRAVFGIEDGGRLAQARGLLSALLDRVGPALVFFGPLRVDLGPWSPWGRYLRERAGAQRLIAQETARRRGEPGEDILSLLLQARDEAGRPLGDEELYGELITLLVAGHETTANTLAWALAWLGDETAVRERLVAEVDSAGDEPEAIAKLPFLGAVCNEVLRIQPVFPIVVRVLAAPWRLGPWALDAGARVAPCIYLVHHREDLYPEPTRFRPDRFLERTYSASEFLPFGGGVRRCIGAAFALYEMKLALATILGRFSLEAVTPGRPRPARRNLAIGPAGGARLRVRAIRPGA
jgi:unspecific monooxygenase